MNDSIDTHKLYKQLCADYSKLSPELKLFVQFAKHNVWNVEINSIKRLRGSAKINEIEKLLYEDHQNILQKEDWECRKEIYRLYTEELPHNSPKVDKISKRIEEDHISLETLISKSKLDFENYTKLSPVEKLRLLLSQKYMFEKSIAALTKRSTSTRMSLAEIAFLTYRQDILSYSSFIIRRCITVIFCKYFTRKSLEIEEIYEEIISSGCQILSDHEFKSKEFCRYPYDFERPNDVSPYEWGSPEVDWKTGEYISK